MLLIYDFMVMIDRFLPLAASTIVSDCVLSIYCERRQRRYQTAPNFCVVKERGSRTQISQPIVLLKIVSDPFFVSRVSCSVGHAIYPIELLYLKADYSDDSLSSFKPRNVCLNTVARDYDVW